MCYDEGVRLPMLITNESSQRCTKTLFAGALMAKARLFMLNLSRLWCRRETLFVYFLICVCLVLLVLQSGQSAQVSVLSQLKRALFARVWHCLECAGQIGSTGRQLRCVRARRMSSTLQLRALLNFDVKRPLWKRLSYDEKLHVYVSFGSESSNAHCSYTIDGKPVLWSFYDEKVPPVYVRLPYVRFVEDVSCSLEYFRADVHDFASLW